MEKIMQIIGLLFGGSKWTVVVAVLGVAALAIYGINTIKELQNKIDVITIDNSTLKANNEKLEAAKKVQDETIEQLNSLIKLSRDVSSGLVKGVNERNKELTQLRQKINTLLTAKVQKQITKAPTEYEKKINNTMIAINKCFEELSKVDVNEEKNETTKPCSFEPIPDFTNGLY